VGTITATDRLHHYFFDQALDGGPHHAQIVAFYERLDDFIGDIYQRSKDQEALFLTCSDHGFTPIKTEIYLNRWLVENGYLTLTDTANGLQGITTDSRAFCLDPARIYIHQKGRYPRGPVESTEYHDLREELSEKLSQISFEGQKVVQQVYRREEIFQGSCAEKGPDLYLLPNKGFDLKGAVNRESTFGKTHFKGMHTYDDAHLFIYPGRDLADPKIEDIAPLIEDFFSPFGPHKSDATI
jgi:predicted AlkP superfamily phosphohydrolase/phosphomutase